MRAHVAEFLGTGFLLLGIVGSGIMGDRLSGGNTAIALLANSLATGAALSVLILTFGPISGGHFNPLVSFAAAWRRRMTWSTAGAYAGSQFVGALVGVGAANFIFQEPLFAWSHHPRSGAAQAVSEVIATFGLLVVIASCARFRRSAVPCAVGGYIAAAYWFTSSTSFANPAVTIARSLTDTFAGIRPSDTPLFMAAQIVGAIGAVATSRYLFDGHS